jgi:hypothetical protein
MRIVLMALALCAMTGCQPQPPPPQASEPLANKEPSDMRTAVPLVRRLDPSETGPLELDFDVPAQADDDTPPLFIGVRVAGDDPTAVADLADGLSRADVSAEVHLYRLQDSSQIAVALERVQWLEPTEVEFVTLAPDGAVPGLSAADADFSSMRAAGLISQDRVYRELKFAGASNVPTGRYRAVIRLGPNRKALFNANAELLIAYTHKGK